MKDDCGIHKLIADVMIQDGNRAYLVKYRDSSEYDGQKGWFLPDDQLEHGEHPDDGARRITEEQLGVTLSDVELGFIESFEGNDTSWHLIFHYRATTTDAGAIRHGANVAEGRWFDLSALPARSEVSHHGWGLDTIETLTKGAGTVA